MTADTNVSTDWKAAGQSFDSVADLYDKYRPSYPIELIEDILLISGIPPEGKILEIGSGTGKATLLFARKGYSILCLEPGQNLLDKATRNLLAFPNVNFVKARFEEWDSGQEQFDLVISAQAYHWVPEEVRYEKTARVLKPHGYLAAFWNMYPGLDDKIKPVLSQVYRNRVPEMVKPEIPFEHEIENRAKPLRESPYFDKIVIRKYPWSARYQTDEYLGLLNTYSDHILLSEQRRSELFRDVSEVIEQNGGFIDRPYVAVLYIAQKSAF